MLRQITDLRCDAVPKHNAFNRGFNRLRPRTLKAIKDLVAQAAVGLGLEDSAMLRVDTTVVASDIHHPTDNTLLWDVCARLQAIAVPMRGRGVKRCLAEGAEPSTLFVGTAVLTNN
jgi:hypothetical protein